MLPITPSRKNLGAQASSLLSFVWQIHGGRLEALRTQDRLVAVEGIEPTSLDYQSSALAVELHREVVDPTGLKPAPHGLKGRRSVTRAPGQCISDCRVLIADWPPA